MCKAKPEKETFVFKNYEHPLSNQHLCDIHVFDEQFSSVDHAWYWRLLLELGHPEEARQVMNARHAGVARSIAKRTTDAEERQKWEEENCDIMHVLLSAKAAQYPRFHNCLLENQNKTIAYATADKLWGTGMSPFVSANTAPQYWPGRNILGAALMELADQLRTTATPQQFDMMLATLPSTNQPKQGIESQCRQRIKQTLDKKKQTTELHRLKQQSATPATTDIRLMLEKKRKTLASSPDEQNTTQEKRLQSDNT